jgi:hypothetical protein
MRLSTSTKKLPTKNEPRIEFTPLFNKQRKAAPLEIKRNYSAGYIWSKRIS